MSGGIIPKRGTGTPGFSTLVNGELGVSTDQKALYLGTAHGPVEIGNRSNTTVISPYANTYTTLSKSKQNLTVNFHNLQTGKTYHLYCLTTSRKGGNKYGDWYHPENFHLGYKNQLEGRYVYDKYQPTIIFQNTPSWMPNNGQLQTEWTLSNSTSLSISLREWIVPLVKPMNETTRKGQPNFSTWSHNSNYYVASIIGVAQKIRASRLFKFCLADEDDIIYPCQQTLKVGSVGKIGENLLLIEISNITGEGFISSDYLCSSIF